MPEQNGGTVDSIGQFTDVLCLPVQYLAGTGLRCIVEAGPDRRPLRNDGSVPVEVRENGRPLVLGSHATVEQEYWLPLDTTFVDDIDIGLEGCRLHTSLRSGSIRLSRTLGDPAVELRAHVRPVTPITARSC